LARAGDRVRSREFYEGLGSISRTALGDGLLESGALDEHRLAFYHALSKMDPLIAPMRGVLGGSAYHAEGINSLIAFLRAHSVLNEEEFRLPARAGMASLARRIQRALGRIPAPDPGFTPPPPFRIVASTEELQSIGKKFGNCVAIPNYNAIEFHFRLVNGSGVFLVSDDHALLVALRRAGGGLWVLEQMAGPKNRAPTKDTQAKLLRDLADIGLKLVSTDPQAAYSRLHHEVRSRRTLADLNEHDLDEDAADGIDEGIEEVAA
jgi:hypothetical protein